MSLILFWNDCARFRSNHYGSKDMIKKSFGDNEISARSNEKWN
jgi:hypothetical protein